MDEDGDELRGAWPLRQRAAGKGLEAPALLLPCEGGHRAYAAFYILPGLAVARGHLRVQPLRDQQQPLRLLGGKLYGI